MQFEVWARIVDWLNDNGIVFEQLEQGLGAVFQARTGHPLTRNGLLRPAMTRDWALVRNPTSVTRLVRAGIVCPGCPRPVSARSSPRRIGPIGTFNEEDKYERLPGDRRHRNEHNLLRGGCR